MMPGNESSTYPTTNSLPIPTKIFIAALSSVSVASALMNGLFLFVLLKKRPLHSPSNTLLGVLSTIDLLTALTAIPLTAIGAAEGQCQSCSAAASFYGSAFSWIFLGLSYQFISLISLDRYAAICHPFKYLQMASSGLFLKVSGCISLLYTMLVILCHLISAKVCKIMKSVTQDMVGGIVLAVLILSNLKIYMAIKRQRKAVMCTTAQSASQHQQHEREKRRSYVVVLLVLVFIVCCLPYYVTSQLLRDADTLRHISKYLDAVALEQWTLFILFLNGIINPVVYYFRLKCFRSALAELLSCN